MWRILASALLAGGCRALLGIDDPVLVSGDGPADSVIDDADAGMVTADARDPSTCAPAPSTCTLFTCAGSSSCYYACDDKHSWPAARDRCVALGLGCLVTVDTDAENACLTAATAPNFPDVVWIGYVQASTGAEPLGGWGWQCGASAFTPSSWGQFEPNDSGGDEDCAALIGGGAWIDSACNGALRFVCEHE